MSNCLAIPLARVKSLSYHAHRQLAGRLGQLSADRLAATPGVGQDN